MERMRQAYSSVLDTIAMSAQKANRKPEEVTLVAVSKGGTVEQIGQLAAWGQLDFGENRVQDLVPRIELCDNKLRWHCIGQLQSNKVKYIINRVQLIHSLDRLSLAGEMERQAQKQGVVANSLVQVRFDEDEKRGGVALMRVRELLDGCAGFAHLRVHGLMCLAPLNAGEPRTRECFSSMRSLFEALSKESWPNVGMETLSMGMSRDYGWAVEHGSTMVRVGSALFSAGQP